MPRFATASVFVFVVAFFVLPLYEFADIGEHWPHDGDYVSMILTVLFFLGLTLILRTSAAVASRGIVAAQCQASGRFEVETRGSGESSSAELHRDPVFVTVPFRPIEPPQFLILQDFRI